MRTVAMILATMLAAPLSGWAADSTMDLFNGPAAVKWSPAPPESAEGCNDCRACG